MRFVDWFARWIASIEEWFRRESPGPVVCDGGSDRELAVTTETVNKLRELIEAARGLVEYRRQSGPLNFQLEKADTFIFRMRVALEELENR